MKTVRDIFAEVLALKQRGLDAWQITDRLMEIGFANGFGSINKNVSDGGGQPPIINLVFTITGEAIYFDGADWHHRDS